MDYWEGFISDITVMSDMEQKDICHNIDLREAWQKLLIQLMALADKLKKPLGIHVFDFVIHLLYTFPIVSLFGDTLIEDGKTLYKENLEEAQPTLIIY